MLVHDLKNPLASASLALSLLKRSAEADPESQPQRAQLLSIVEESHGELGDLIDDLLVIARGESGAGVPLNLEPADLIEMIRGAARGFRARAENSKVELVEEYAAESLALTLDAPKIRRVLENLLDNALKYTPAGGRVEVRATPEEGGARVRVLDTGPGIPHALQQRIFDRFAQAAARQAGEHVSVGLGLTFCRLVIEAHGGRLWVESRPGAGSSFIFTLPAAPLQPIGPENH
jgi:signal transduction histidine kinase